MDFVAIDFETATSARNSPCSIGITKVVNNKVIETKTWLIKPSCWPLFNPFNTSIHGISPAMVKDAPTFAQLWPDIAHYFNDSLVIAHNAAFDIGVLKSTLESFGVALPSFSYLCSCNFSRKVWPGRGSYSLDNLCRFHAIKLKHHDAGEDAHAAAKIAIYAFEDLCADTLDEFCGKLSLKARKFGVVDVADELKTARKKTPKIANLMADPSLRDPNSVYCGKIVVFTGTLSRMSRIRAAQKIINIGGAVFEFITEEVDYLVVGNKASRFAVDGELSKKHRVALELAANGGRIQVVTEAEFFNHIS